MTDAEWTPPRAQPNNEPFTKGPPDPFRFDFQTAELLLGQLSKEFELMNVKTLADFVEKMKAKYNAGVLDAAAHARKRTEARLHLALETQGRLINECGEAAGLRDVGFKAPEVIVGAIRELRQELDRVTAEIAREREITTWIRPREVEAPIDERTEPNGPVPPPVPAIAGGAVGGADPTPSEKQGQGPQARPVWLELLAMCQEVYPQIEGLSRIVGNKRELYPQLEALSRIVCGIEKRIYELNTVDE